MKKTKKGLISILSMGAIVAPLVAAVSCGVDNNFESWSGSHRDIITTTNTKNSSYTQAFASDGSRSNLGTGVQTLLPSQGRLMTLNYDGENEVDGGFNNVSTDPNYGSLENPLKTPRAYMKLELAKSIEYQDQSGVWHSYESIEDPVVEKKFRAGLQEAQAMRFTIRDDMYWVDSNGLKTKYKITAEDFLAGFRMHGFQYMGSWRTELDGGAYKDDVIEVEKYLNTKWSARMDYNRNTDNNYLFSLAGVNFSKVYGLNNKNEPIANNGLNVNNSPLNYLGKDENGKEIFDNTLTFKITGNSEDIYPEMLIDKIFIDPVTTWSPVPVEYIKDQYENNFDASNNLPKESTLAKMGFYKYGFTYSDMLYSGRYYIDVNDATKSVMRQNTHYWDTDWVENPHTIRSFTQNFRTQDASLLPIITYEKFKQGTEYKMPVSEVVSKLYVGDQVDIYNENSVKYSFEATTMANGSGGLSTWTALPVIKDGTPYFNDNFSNIMYGKTISDFTSNDGGAMVGDHFATIGLAFRSQIEAIINWFAVKQLLKQPGMVWNTATPPGAIVPSIGSNAATTAIDAIFTGEEWKEHDPNGLGYDYYSYANNKLQWEGTVTATEQIDTYGASSSGSLLASSDYDDIIKAMTDTFVPVFGTSQDVTIEFTYPIRQLYSSALRRTTYKQIVETIESIKVPLGQSGKYATFKIKEVGSTPRSSYNPDYNSDVSPLIGSNYAPVTYQGWSADINSLIAWYVGPIASTGRASASLIQPLSRLAVPIVPSSSVADKAYAETFPQTTKLAQAVNEQFEGLRLKILSDIASNESLFFVQNIDSSLKSDIMDILKKENLFYDIRTYSTTQLTSKQPSEYFFTDEQIKGMTSTLRGRIDELTNIASSIAFFNIQKTANFTSQAELLELERELRNLVGNPMHFESNFTTSSKIVPEANVFKPWLTLATPSWEQSLTIQQWRVDDGGSDV